MTGSSATGTVSGSGVLLTAVPDTVFILRRTLPQDREHVFGARPQLNCLRYQDRRYLEFRPHIGQVAITYRPPILPRRGSI
jgi:hypothetical protein